MFDFKFQGNILQSDIIVNSCDTVYFDQNLPGVAH